MIAPPHPHNYALVAQMLQQRLGQMRQQQPAPPQEPVGYAPDGVPENWVPAASDNGATDNGFFVKPAPPSRPDGGYSGAGVYDAQGNLVARQGFGPPQDRSVHEPPGFENPNFQPQAQGGRSLQHHAPPLPPIPQPAPNWIQQYLRPQNPNNAGRYPVSPYGLHVTTDGAPASVFGAMRKALPAATKSAIHSHQQALIERFMRNQSGKARAV